MKQSMKENNSIRNRFVADISPESSDLCPLISDLCLLPSDIRLLTSVLCPYALNSVLIAQSSALFSLKAF